MGLGYTFVRWSVYVRISEDRTGEEWGVERQLRDIHQAISGRDSNPQVTEFIENDVSAYKKRPRPRFEEMMRRVEAGDFDVICAKHMDRLLRRLLELEETLQRCEATGTYIITTHDGVDTSTEGGRLVARILASVAQGEVERKKARQVSAFKQAAEHRLSQSAPVPPIPCSLCRFDCRITHHDSNRGGKEDETVFSGVMAVPQPTVISNAHGRSRGQRGTSLSGRASRGVGGLRQQPQRRLRGLLC